MLLNAENLFLLSDSPLEESHLDLEPHRWSALSTSVFENKPVEKCKSLAKIITENQSDIVMLCEVGGFESLANFNRLFLKDQYSPILIEGNSDRHIDVGFLVRKGLPFYFDLHSNKNRPINYLYPFERENLDNPTVGKTAQGAPSHKFSRDAAELHLFKKDREKPFAIFILTHLKSRLDPEGVDPNGFERRQAELKTLIELYNEIENKFKGQVPISVCGDFNGNASGWSTDSEFLYLYQETALKDVCSLAGLSPEESATYYQVNRSARPEGRQIDFCFLSPRMKQYLTPDSVQVYRYKNHLGQPIDPPTTLDAKSKLPSDHYPILFSLKQLPIS
jgi:exonuclease III